MHSKICSFSLHILKFAFLLIILLIINKSEGFEYEKSEPDCKTGICVYKCCPEKNIIQKKRNVTTSISVLKCVKPTKDIVIAQMDYTKIQTPKGPSLTKTKTQNCTSNKYGDCIEFIDKSDIFISHSERVVEYACAFKILQDGSLESQSEDCPTMEKYKFCVDYYLRKNKKIDLMYLALRDDTSEADMKENISATGESYPSSWGMAISAFFILLVLLVYALLPKLQNIVGLVLMAYLFTFMVAIILRILQMKARFDEQECRKIGPAAYFFLLASFFWLNIMAFDIWWTIRGSRKCRAIHRQGELVKFLWYTLYAWGTPLALTLSIVVVDEMQLYTKDMIKAPFAGCFSDAKSSYVYIGVPMGILIFVNLILFLTSAVELRLINRDLASTDSGNTKNNSDRFVLYIKLFVIMGVNWLLELVPNEINFVLYIFVNLSNVLIGVILFGVFVCKKSVFIMLCNRFKIKSNFVDNLKSSQYSRSKTTTSSINVKGTNKNDLKRSGATAMEDTLGNIYPELEVKNLI